MVKIVIETGETFGIPPDILKKYYRAYNKEIYFYIFEVSTEDILSNGYYINTSDTIEGTIPYISDKYLGRILPGDYFSKDNYVPHHLDDFTRLDPIMIDLVESNQPKGLKIVDIPNDVKWKVQSFECSNGEYIEEEHRTWS